MLAPIVSIIGVSALFGKDLLQQFIAFSETVDQGSYAEGWRLPLEYLWHAEHLLLPVWLFALVYALCEARKGRVKKPLMLGMAGILFIYSVLVIFSVGLEKFVVYGRLARQVVPFFCLITAHYLRRLYHSSATGRNIFIGLFMTLGLQAGFNFYAPLTQVFPPEFRQNAEICIANSPQKQYFLVYAHRIYPRPTGAPPPTCTTHLKARHPLQFLPYQYEGYPPQLRRVLRSVDISMRLVSCPEGKGNSD